MRRIVFVLFASALISAGCLLERPPSASPTPTLSPAPSPTISITPFAANVSIHFINVSLGESIFVDTPGKDVLIDAGCRSCGKQVVAYLQSIGEWPEVLAASNHDEDHMGGLLAFLSTNSTYAIWDSGSIKDTIVFRDFTALAQLQNFSVVQRGRVFQLDSTTRITVLNPVQPLEFTKENDNSVVMRLDAGNFSVMLSGDCESPCEKSILASGLSLQSTVLKAGHHCSKTSTSDAFLDAVRPQLAICGVGITGAAKYGHPYAEVLARFDARSIPYYVTMRDGSVVLASNGAGFAVSKNAS